MEVLLIQRNVRTEMSSLFLFYQLFAKLHFYHVWNTKRLTNDLIFLQVDVERLHRVRIETGKVDVEGDLPKGSHVHLFAILSCHQLGNSLIVSTVFLSEGDKRRQKKSPYIFVGRKKNWYN